jgi:hypothetical protein
MKASMDHHRSSVEDYNHNEGYLMKVIYCVLSAATIGACSMTLPVQGSIEDGSETFTGQRYRIHGRRRYADTHQQQGA